LASLNKRFDDQSRHLEDTNEKLKDEQDKRRVILNELEDLKGKIRVYCRIRPFSESEQEDSSKFKNSYEINDAMSVTIHGRLD